MTTIGFLGLGAMGSAMARNLLRDGGDLRVWNRSSGKAGALLDAGAREVATPVELAACDVVFAMLASDAATREAVVDSGLAAALQRTSVFVNCATISVALARELGERFAATGVAYVAAPVLGRPDAAVAAKLNIIAAGDGAVLDRLAPLLERIGQKTFRVGAEPALANVAKIGANFLIASAIEALAESFALSDGNGLAPRTLHEIVASTIFAGAPVYENYGTQIIEERTDPGFQLKLGLKDIGLALEAGTAAGLALPVAQTLSNVFAKSVEAGDGERDWTAIARQLKPDGAARP